MSKKCVKNYVNLLLSFINFRSQ